MCKVSVIGAGLAGSEAAYQLARRGVSVVLYEMKPHKRSPAHVLDGFCELVCSNSLGSDAPATAAGLLKEELRRMDSLVMRAADATRVPAGGALAVDRRRFSEYVTQALRALPQVRIEAQEVTDLGSLSGIRIVAAGPLASEALSRNITDMVGGQLSFYDAAAPIVTAESIDRSCVYPASRYGRGNPDDYLNCPMTREQYDAFYDALISAECAEVRGFEKNVFEGCMPVEVMASRGRQTLCFGPLKPVGLPDPRTGREPYAVVQLRKENLEATMYNLVGFQTHLKFGEQKRVFGMIPGLAGAEFVRYGVMHRNTYLNSPGILDANYRMRERRDVYFAGQITGVEGYVESTASGLVAGISAACQARGLPLPVFSDATALGALAKYVSQSASPDFQPMKINFGILRPADRRFRKKAEKHAYIAKRALLEIDEMRVRERSE